MKRKPSFSPNIGLISSLNPEEDPIGDLGHALRLLLRQCRVDRETRKAHVALVNWAEYPHGAANAKQVMKDLTEALSHYAPPYTTFGERENDRGETEWGFWPNNIDDEVQAGNLIYISDGYDGHVVWGEDVARVNDHGNVECGRFDKRGRWHEYWSCV